jgi:hypothetical protein
VAFAFRSSSPADLASIAALCTRILAIPERSPVFSAEHMRWKYWDTWPSWQGSRSFMLFKNDALIAHAGVVPLRFSREGQCHTLLQLIDWAAEPGQVGAGVTLLKRIAALADGAMSVRGSSMTQRILGPLGFRSLGETLRYAAPTTSASSPPRSPLAGIATLRIHRSGDSHLREHPLSQAHSTDEQAVFQRSAAQIEAWLRCPVAAMQYGEVCLDDQLIGSFLLCHTPGQLRIADAWADPRREGAWNAVIELAYRHASAQPNAAEVVCQSNDPAQQRALERCGFRSAGADPLAVLTSPTLVPDGALCRHHLIDSDLAYLHHGEMESWLA